MHAGNILRHASTQHERFKSLFCSPTQRLSGTVEVLLLWPREIDRVELSVRDVSTGAGFHLEVAPANAIDAFYHPYAYAARRENSYRVAQAETTIFDG